MANLFYLTHRQNADKLWTLFFQRWAEADKGTDKLYVSDWQTPANQGFGFLERYFDGTARRFQFTDDMAICLEMVKAHRDKVLAAADNWIRNLENGPQREFTISIRDWIIAD
jgi:hypothetical protein